MKRADRYFSHWIRQSRADEGGTVQCRTCGKLMHWTECHCGHFVRRGRHATRYEERNCGPQCPSCNTYRGGREWEHGQYIDKTYGEGTAAELKRLGETILKTTKRHFDDVAETYRGKIIEEGYVTP